METQVTEYTLIFKDGTEFISEDLDETNTIFEFEKRKDNVDQYYSKTWILVDDDWKEDYVEVFYSAKE